MNNKALRVTVACAISSCAGGHHIAGPLTIQEYQSSVRSKDFSDPLHLLCRAMVNYQDKVNKLLGNRT